MLHPKRVQSSRIRCLAVSAWLCKPASLKAPRPPRLTASSISRAISFVGLAVALGNKVSDLVGGHFAGDLGRRIRTGLNCRDFAASRMLPASRSMSQNALTVPTPSGRDHADTCNDNSVHGVLPSRHKLRLAATRERPAPHWLKYPPVAPLRVAAKQHIDLSHRSIQLLAQIALDGSYSATALSIRYALSRFSKLLGEHEIVFGEFLRRPCSDRCG